MCGQFFFLREGGGVRGGYEFPLSSISSLLHGFLIFVDRLSVLAVVFIDFGVLSRRMKVAMKYFAQKLK